MTCFPGLLVIFQLMAGAVLLEYFEQYIVMFLGGLRLIITIFLGLAELLYRSIFLGWTPIQVLLGICRVKFIAFLNRMRLVPVIRVPFLIAENTVTMGAAMDIRILLFTLSWVYIALLLINPSSLFSVGIVLIRLLGFLILDGTIMGFVIRIPPIVLVL